ncbi:hypothetical protein M8J75_005093 [Diaphorina citri]|nr:hypothetical protein M8J75_005093 [Diaphorina citri]
MASSPTKDPTESSAEGEELKLIHLGFTYTRSHPQCDGTSVFKCIHTGCQAALIVKRRKKPEKGQKQYKFVGERNEHSYYYCSKSEEEFRYSPSRDKHKKTTDDIPIEELMLHPDEQDLYKAINTELMNLQNCCKDERDVTTSIKNIVIQIFKKLCNKDGDVQLKEDCIRLLKEEIKQLEEEIKNKDNKIMNCEKIIEDMIETEQQNEKNARETIEELREELNNTKSRNMDNSLAMELNKAEEMEEMTNKKANEEIFFSPKKVQHNSKHEDMFYTPAHIQEKTTRRNLFDQTIKRPIDKKNVATNTTPEKNDHLELNEYQQIHEEKEREEDQTVKRPNNKKDEETNTTPEKENHWDEHQQALEEKENLIENLKTSLETVEIAWKLDKTELENMKKKVNIDQHTALCS